MGTTGPDIVKYCMKCEKETRHNTKVHYEMFNYTEYAKRCTECNTNGYSSTLTTKFKELVAAAVKISVGIGLIFLIQKLLV